MQNTSRLCNSCSQIASTRKNVVLLEQSKPPYKKTFLSQNGVEMHRKKKDIAQQSTSGCPMCQLIQRALQKREKLETEGTRIKLASSEVVILLFLTTNNWLRTSPKPTNRDIECLAVHLTEKDGLWSLRRPRRSHHLFNVLVSAAEGKYDPAAKHITTRPIVIDKVSTHTFKLVQHQLKECRDKHTACNERTTKSMPTRVIDLDPKGSGESLQLIGTNRDPGLYAALSYAWGMREQRLMTLKRNVEMHQRDIPASALPRTVSDAIFVARRLGIRYLWVDSICIIQDCLEDREREVGRMKEIFSNSLVTISAACATSCDDGFLETQTLPTDDVEGGSGWFTPFDLPYTCANDDKGKLYIQPKYRFNLKTEPISQRAWTLEERLLSPRVLIYGTNRMVWQCQTHQVALGGPNDGNHDGIGRLPTFVFNGTDVEHQDSSNWQSCWEDTVNAYSRRNLTRKEDRLRSIAGIAAKFQTAVLGTRYLAGLLHEDGERKSFLLTQLTWIRGVPRGYPDFPEGPPSNLFDPRTSPADNQAPSWSWASVDGGVSWMKPPGRTYDTSNYPSEVIEYCVEPTSHLNPFGRVKGGKLTLRGPCRNLEGTLRRGKTFWEFRIPTVTSVYSTFGCDISGVSPQLEGKVIEVTLLQITEYAGIVIQPTGQDTFLRIGMFRFRKLNEAKAFMFGAESRVVVLE